MDPARSRLSAAAVLAATTFGSGPAVYGQDAVRERLLADAPYKLLPQAVFETLGSPLPDGGRHVKALADGAPGGALDPAALEGLSPEAVGYRARWRAVRYRRYGLDWHITGLHLQPVRPDPALPTIAIVHGGSANWYEFLLDPLNGPGLGQYLAQTAPVLLITIPGNYKPGGWPAAGPYDERSPAYVLDAALPAEEVAARNAAYTFALVAEGVRRLLEEATRGPLVLVGHSTGGELPFLLNASSLKERLAGRFLGWGTGGPAWLRRRWEEEAGRRATRVSSMARYPHVARLRARSAEGYAQSDYVGPWNPLAPGSRLEVARRWFEREGARRPQFKQVLQDIEHAGMLEHRERIEKQIRETLASRTPPAASEVIGELFTPSASPAMGYSRMVWIVGGLDDGHWNRDPERALDLAIARAFRETNPSAAVRVLAIDAPLTHYGHIERPKQLASVLLSAARWLFEP